MLRLSPTSSFGEDGGNRRFWSQPPSRRRDSAPVLDRPPLAEAATARAPGAVPEGLPRLSPDFSPGQDTAAVSHGNEFPCSQTEVPPGLRTGPDASSSTPEGFRWR